MYDAQLEDYAGLEELAARAAGIGYNAALHSRLQGASAAQAAMFLCILDEIDYGLVLLGADARILLANELAQLELGGERYIRRRQNRFAPSAARLGGKIESALERARRGLRSLVTLSGSEGELALSFVPIKLGADCAALLPDTPLAMVILGRRDPCEALTLQQYGQLHGLSGAEQALLPAIIRGLSVEAMAQQQCVSSSTVRTQLGSIREKTGVRSLRLLAARLTSLPPIRPSFKQWQAH